MLLAPNNAGRLASTLVACNVYVSAGGQAHHTAILTNLLRQAQSYGQSVAPLSSGVVVHAYADVVYNRSSFHLAGRADYVVPVASNLAVNAVRTLREARDSRPLSEESSSHPFVGLVDHIAVMPLEEPHPGSERLNDNEGTNSCQSSTAWTSSGWAARQIGEALSQHNIEVHYYGSAHPDAVPLAIVRRDRTNFFKSGGLAADFDEALPKEVATIGAPMDFVENYNVRLSNVVTKSMAQSLTRHVRERDGGLPGVEALTLPYSEGRWEVACNLLRLDLAGANDVQVAVDEWESRQRHQNDMPQLVEKGYRVGTSVQQCLQALSCVGEAERLQHDGAVRHGLHKNLEALKS